MIATAAVRLDARLAHRRGARARRRLPLGADDRWVETARAVLRARVIRSAHAGARTVVIVPDPPNTLEHYDALMPRLVERFHVVAFEAPGFGHSYPRASFGFTVREWASTIVEALDGLRVRDAVAAFSCVGVFGALVAARERPELFGRLVVAQAASCAAMRAWIGTINAGGVVTTPFVGQALTGIGRRLVARKWYDVAVPADLDPQPFAAPALGALARGGSFCLATAFQRFLRDGEDVGGARQEAVLLWGASDPTHGATDPDTLRAHLPHAAVVRCAGCGHFPHLERPDVFLDALGR